MRLNLKPIRFWQLKNQAIMGMMVGLLHQPRLRGNEHMENQEQQELKKLRARVKELELIVSTKTKLIEILKSMPGCQGVSVKDEKPRVSTRGKKVSGAHAIKCSTREPNNNSKDVGGDKSNPEGVEETLS